MYQKIKPSRHCQTRVGPFKAALGKGMPSKTYPSPSPSRDQSPLLSPRPQATAKAGNARRWGLLSLKSRRAGLQDSWPHYRLLRILPGKNNFGKKFYPKFRDSIFTRGFTEVFPLFFRKVQFHLVID
jgi:hypothetical protein